MTDRELMQQALKAMGTVGADWICEASHHAKKDQHKLGEPCPLQQRWHIAYQALRERLAQPEQEPVAHLWQHSETGRTRIVLPGQIVTADATWHVVGPLYLTPPRREWRGLSDDDLEDLLGFHCDIYGEMNEVDAKKFAADIEKRLKEKNA